MTEFILVITEFYRLQTDGCDHLRQVPMCTVVCFSLSCWTGGLKNSALLNIAFFI